MMFCPKCRSEYRDGIRQCPDCRLDLVPERPGATHDDVTLVPLVRTYSPNDVAMIRSILDGSGIRFFIQGENALHVRPCADPAILIVASGDVEEAKELLADLDLTFMLFSIDHTENGDDP